MMLWLVALLPLVVGPILWAAGRHRSRTWLGTVAALAIALTGGIAVWGAVTRVDASYRWGAGLELRLSVDAPASVVMVLVPAVALVVAVYAAAHEPGRGLARLIGTLVAFVGTMELLVVAADLITLLIAWELVGAFSWALIAHEWWHGDKPRAASHAFVVTRFGDLALFAAAGAALAGVGSLRYDALGGLSAGWLHVFTAGVVLAAATKSAQVPFSPWLFSAMAGPTPVSALLHAATMVAAGVFIVVRFHPVLDLAGWFAPVTIAIGLATALAGGVVAAVQQHAKRLLAASTSAQYGLMFVAVGAGVPAAALAHLAAHAVMKIGLFLSAGVAMAVAGSPELGRMRLGRTLPRLAAWTAVSALALAAVPPLGAAWTKETIGAAAGHHASWLAPLVAAAGGLSAFYATRFQLLAYGRRRRGAAAEPASAPATATPNGDIEADVGAAEPSARGRARVQEAAIAAAGFGSVALGVVWLPGAEGIVEEVAGGRLVPGKPWEIVLSLALVAVGIAGAARARVALEGTWLVRRLAVAGWMGLPRVAKAWVVDPVLGVAAALGRLELTVMDAAPRAAAAFGRRLSLSLARGDGRIVDAGVRAVAAAARWASRVGAAVTERRMDGAVRDLARFAGGAGRGLRRLHTGLVHHYYVALAAGAVIVLVIAAVGR